MKFHFYLDKIIWLIFMDVLIRFVRARDKWKFIKENPFDIIAALPATRQHFSNCTNRALVPCAAFICYWKKYLTPVKNILATNGLGKLLTVSAGILIVATVLVTFSDIDTYTDGIY